MHSSGKEIEKRGQNEATRLLHCIPEFLPSRSMRKTKSVRVVAFLTIVVLLISCGCGGSSSSSALNLSGTWHIAASGLAGGTATLTQHGTQITGQLTAPNYYGPIPGVGLPSISGTLNGTMFQATITGTYGPYACGAGVINISLTIDLAGTVAASGNSMAGQLVAQPYSCYPGGIGNWSATKG
jgi:hypothetical protein